MSINRDILRAEAKKLYKEQIKSIPKRSRITFAQFYENFKKSKNKKVVEVKEEDFDIEQVVKINDET